MDVMEAIKTRRTVRRFSSQPVSDDLIEAILEAGRWAPSWANSQCWRFIVVRDASIRASLADTISPGNPATEAITKAPVTIAVCGQMGKAGYKQGEAKTDKGDWYMFDTALATQNMVLAAHALGLGTVIVGLFDAAQAATTLHLPPDVQVVILLPLGYPMVNPIAPSRKALAKIASTDRYTVDD